jgi:hypothetical protein
MIILSYKNITNLIFYDKKVQQILPELSQIFQKWIIGTRTGLNSVAKDASLEFLDNLSQNQIEKLANYWGSPVIVQKTDSNIVKNYKFLLDDINIVGQWNVCLARKDNQIYLSLWR